MADKRNPLTGDDATGRQEPANHSTSTFDPLAEHNAGDAGPDPATKSDGAGRGAGASRSDSDATAVLPASDATTTLPATGRSQSPTPRIWAARVPIPPDDIAPMRRAAPPDWLRADADEAGEQRGDRSWVRPVVVTLVVVVLVAMLGTGLWLIFHGRGRSTPLPAGTSTASPTPATDTATATETATGTAPTETATPTETVTGEPTATAAPVPPLVGPTTAAAAQVRVPDLAGQTWAQAKLQLTARGFRCTMTTRAAPGAPAGTVIATEPVSGSVVGRGSRVNVVVAAAARATASPSPTANASAGATD
jgi:hypothetical protein